MIAGQIRNVTCGEMTAITTDNESSLQLKSGFIALGHDLDTLDYYYLIGSLFRVPPFFCVPVLRWFVDNGINLKLSIR